MFSSYEDEDQQIYNKAQMIKNPNTGKVWNIYEDQRGEGAWIISYQQEEQAVLPNTFSSKKRNETWRIGKKMP